MRPAPSLVRPTADRPRPLVKHRAGSAGRSRRRRRALEALEPRTLMAVLPAVTVTGQVQISGIANPPGNETSPSVAIDPTDPTKLVAVWTRDDPAHPLANSNGQTTIYVDGAYSTDSGATWTGLTGVTQAAGDFSRNQQGGPFFFPRITDPSVGFDRNGKVYVSYSYHEADNSAGMIAIQKMDFTSTSPVALGGPLSLYTWTQDAALAPVVTVDSNLRTFADPQRPSAVQNDPNTGNVYVTWGTRDALDAGRTNPNRVDMVASTDGGLSYTAPVPLNDGVDFGPAAATPSVTISQGSAVGAIAGGKLTAVWNNLAGGIASSQVDGKAAQDNFPYSGGNAGIAYAAAATASGQPDSPATTSFPVTVDITDPKFVSVRSLEVSLGVVSPGANAQRIVLVPPTGSGLPQITLLANNTDAFGNTTGQGVGGGNLGQTNSGAFLGTVFDQFAGRALQGNPGGAATVGHFRAADDLSVFNGMTPAQVNGTWTLQITDYRNGGNNPPPFFLQSLSLNFTSGLLDSPDVAVNGGKTGVLAVAGAPTAPFPTASAAVPDTGIAPAPVIVTDNTLGAFSPHQGWMYVAYVAPGGGTTGPGDNTNIELSVSKDGGQTWSKATRVNDDSATKDGYTDASGTFGRPQFEPALAVDPATGTLVISFLDARNDAARARVATYLATSIDGGQTFSPETYANPSLSAIDAADGNTVILSPLPDNVSAANPYSDKNFDFGPRQGLAVANGHVYPVWTSNFNTGGGPTNVSGATNIVTAKAVIAAGPRVVSSTMGPVGEPGDAINNLRAPDGSPEAGAFVITFDRPIDPTTFTLADVQIFYRDTDPNGSAVSIAPSNIQPQDNGAFGATTFLVSFPPQSAVGTYSYLVHPNLRDRIRTVTAAQGTQGLVTLDSSAPSGPTPSAPFTIPVATNASTPSVTKSTITLSGHHNQTIQSLTLSLLNLTAPRDGDLTLTLINQDGTTVSLYQKPADAGSNFSGTTFSDSATTGIGGGAAPYSGTFQPSQPLGTLFGLAVDGVYTLEIQNASTTNTATFTGWNLTVNGVASQANTAPVAVPAAPNASTPSVTQSTITLVGHPGQAVANLVGQAVQNLNIGLNLSDPRDGDLTIKLIAHDGTTVLLYQKPADAGSNFSGTTFGDSGTTTVAAGTAPYGGTFRPTQALSAMVGQPIDQTWTLEIDNASTTNTATLNSWSLAAATAPATKASSQPSGPTPAAPVALPLTSRTESTITLAGHPGQTIANLALNVNVAAPHDGILTLSLIAPNGTKILLYQNSGDQGANFNNTGFSDLAAQPISAGTAPYAGTFRPAQSLSSALNGLPVDGVYTLEIDNSSTTFTGTFSGWSLAISTPGAVTQTTGLGASMDQNANAIPGQDALAGGPGPLDVYSAPGVTGTFRVNSDGSFPAPFSQDTLPLIVPGPHLTGSVVAADGGSTLLLNGVVGANPDGTAFGVPAAHPGIDVTFDRDMDPTSFTPASVLRMMGPAGLVTGPFTITGDPNGTDPDPAHPRTFRVDFPPQDLSGTYVLTLAASIRSESGAAMDVNLNAGVDILFGGANNAATVATTPVTYVAQGADVVAGTPPAATTQAFPVAIPDATIAGGVTTPGVLTSDLVVPDNFLIQGVTAAGLGGLTVQLDIMHPNDPDLTATLLGPVQADGTRPSVVLFSNVGAAGSHANFINTVFDDQATRTPIQKGGPPFFGTFAPQQSLLAAFGPRTVDGTPTSLSTQGTWTLVLTDGVADNPAGTGHLPQALNNWSLTFQKPLPGSGLGEPVADRSTASFRIFTMDPTNPLASDTWTAVGPASIGGGGGTGPEGGGSGGRSGRIGGLAVDPSDPSGNTVYVGGASGGIWKTTNFLSPGGPTYVPLTDFGPTNGINIGGIAVFARNNDPNQSIVFAATGEGDTGTSGVGFLRSMDGGATWTLLDSLDNTQAFTSPLRDHTFAKNGGTSAFKIEVDPTPTPTGDVIVYAALSGGNGGIWRSVDTGQHWQLMRAGQATDLALDPDSGLGVPGGNLQILYAAFRGEGVFLSPNRGQVFNLMAGGIGDPLIQDAKTGNPITVSAPADTPQWRQGAHRPGQARPDRRPGRRPGLRGLALRRGRQPRQQRQRPVHDQGLRPELGQGPLRDRAAGRHRRRREGPGGPHQRLHQGRLQHRRRPPRHRPALAGQLRHQPGDRPDQPQCRLPRRDRRRPADRLHPGRHHRHQRRPRPGRPQPGQPRRRPAQRQRGRLGGAGRDDGRPVLQRRRLPELHPRPGRPVRLRGDARGQRGHQLRQQRRQHQVDPLRHRRDRPAPHLHRQGPADRPRPADHRRRPGGLLGRR